MFTNGDITLRVPEPHDLEMLMQWENDPEHWAVSQTTVPFSRHVMVKFIESGHDLMEQKQVRFMVLKGGDVFGAVDLFDYDPVNLRAGVGILIDRSARRQGIAEGALRLLETYCRDVLLLRNLHASIHSGNLPSVKLFEKAGYVNCGLRRNWYRTPQGWQDELLYINQLDRI